MISSEFYNTVLSISRFKCSKEICAFRYSYWPFEGVVIIILVLFNCILVISDNRFRHLEILHRVKHLVKQIEGTSLSLGYCVALIIA